MKQKPSKRIDEIIGEYLVPRTITEASLLLALIVESVIKYLDEIYEKEQGELRIMDIECNHEWRWNRCTLCGIDFTSFPTNESNIKWQKPVPEPTLDEILQNSEKYPIGKKIGSWKITVEKI